MSAVYESLAWNIVLVVPLALVLWALSRRLRRPEVLHLLWVALLLKLVTPACLPAVWSIPLPSTTIVADESSGTAPSDVQPTGTRVFPPESVGTPNVVSAVHQSSSTTGSGLKSSPPAHGDQTASAASTVTSTDRSLSSTSWSSSAWWNACLSYLCLLPSQYPRLVLVLGWAWGLGSAIWLVTQTLRTWFFQSQINRTAVPSPGLQALVNDLSDQFGIRRPPRICLVQAQISPLLCGFGSNTRILFPERLLDRLSEAEVESLILHELGHFHRRDAWVRLIEFVVSVIYWWHPAVWLARREIERAEEASCDLWVKRRLGSTARHYASALVETVDFLSGVAPASSPTMTGVGSAPFLKERLRLILEKSPPRPPLSPTALAGVATTALAVLLTQPLGFAALSSSALQPELGQIGPQLPDDWTPTTTEVTETNEEESPRVTPRPMIPPAPAPRDSLAERQRRLDQRSARGERSWSQVVAPNGRWVLHTTTARRLLAVGFNDEQSSREIPVPNVVAAAFLGNEDRLLLLSRDTQLTCWNLQTESVERTYNVLVSEPCSLDVYLPGNWCVVASQDGQLVRLALDTGEVLDDGLKVDPATTSVRCSPDGNWLATAAGDWRSGNGSLMWLPVNRSGSLRRVRLPQAVGCAAFVSADELVIGLADGQLLLFNRKTETIVGTSFVEKSLVAAAAFSPNHAQLPSATFDPVLPLDQTPLFETLLLSPGGTVRPMTPRRWVPPITVE